MPKADPKRKKRIMRKFKMTEISAVDVPAQSGAVATIMKRDDKNNKEDENTKINKHYSLTSADEGHTHLVDSNPLVMARGGGETSYTEGHDHPFVILENGSIIIGEAKGHSHTVETIVHKKDSLNKTAAIDGDLAHKEITMPKNTPADKTANNDEIAVLKAQLVTAQGLATLTDVQKAYHATLSEEDQKLFLNKTSTERDDAINLTKAEDPIIYTSDDGTEFKKSDDPRLVAMAKRADKSEKLAIQQRVANENMQLEKRAESEFQYLPGEKSTHVAILKALDSIKDDTTRENAYATLKAHNTKMAPAFQEIGHQFINKNNSGEVSGAKDAEAELDKLAKAHCEKNPDVDYYTAYEIVSAANPVLINKALGS